MTGRNVRDALKLDACGYAHDGASSAMGCVDNIERLVHLYRCERWSTYRIAESVGLSRQQVARRLKAAGVRLRDRGAGGRRVDRRVGEPAEMADQLKRLYIDQRLSAREIGLCLGMPERTVRDRLAEVGVPRRTRGRLNREDRRVLPREVLAEWYEAAGLTAAQVGAQTGTSRGVVLRNAHDLGVGVRLGGPPPGSGPTEILLVEALYADPLVAAVLTRHEVPVVVAGAPLWERFPEPVALTAVLVEELYVEAGVSTAHVELLTGQPAATVTRLLHRWGVPLRPPGGRCPFLRRWRGAARAGQPDPDRPARRGVSDITEYQPARVRGGI